jgi:predicted DCC family thiol-disulfide oxidoreductase YuxK
MRALYLFYDDRCELCRRLKLWLEGQPTWLPLRLLPAGGDQMRQLFPGLEEVASAEDLVAVNDEGEVYLNNNAWIMCLYALVRYRDWAFRLSHPLLLPLARQAFEALSRNRSLISRWLSTSNPETIAQELRCVSLRPCSPDHETIADYLE